MSGCLGIFGFLLGASPGNAAVYTITTFAEDTLANGNCTLREALLAASTDGSQDLCAGDVAADEIVLALAGTYELDDGDIGSAARTLTVRGAAGAPASAYVVDLGGAQRLISVGAGSDLTLANLTLFDGSGGIRGGAVLAEDSELTLRDVIVSSSRADNGGAVSFQTQAEHHLDIEGAQFTGNVADGDQAAGGAVEVRLEAASSARIVDAVFLGNGIVAATGSFSREGGGLRIESFGGSTVELRYLHLEGNFIDAPSFASGAGMSFGGNLTGSFLLEDATVLGNDFVVSTGTNSAAGMTLAMEAPNLTARRLRVLDNQSGTGRYQVQVQAVADTDVVLSDFLIANGDGVGIYVITSGSACSLVAGNFTVAGHPMSGLRLQEDTCPIRIENSIAFGNATSSGSNVEIFVGDPEVSPETLVGVDPQFVDAANGDFRLGPGSVAAEAGEDGFVSVGPFDVAHGGRIAGADLDLGALERGAIFADDFERDDRLAWSSAVPE